MEGIRGRVDGMVCLRLLRLRFLEMRPWLFVISAVPGYRYRIDIEDMQYPGEVVVVVEIKWRERKYKKARVFSPHGFDVIGERYAPTVHVHRYCTIE